MSAPARSSRSVVCALVVERHAVGRHRHQRRRAARQQDQQTRRPADATPASSSARRPARSLPAVGTGGRRRSTRSGGGAGAGVGAMTSPPRTREPSRARRGAPSPARPSGGDTTHRRRREAPASPWRAARDRRARPASHAANAGPDDGQEIVSRDRRVEASVGVLGIGPGGEAGDDVEFLEERADQLRSVVLRAELLELSHDSGERRFDVGDGAL